MATLRELKGRIGSVASSEKITGAMKMISSAKMHKAEQQLKQLVPFRNQIEAIIANLLSADARFSSPLLDSRQVSHITVAVWGSDDGLCGAYNVNVYKQLVGRIAELRKEFGTDVKFTVISVGNKMAKVCAKLTSDDVEVRTAAGIVAKTEGDAVKPFAYSLVDDFLKGRTDRVELLYMNFISISRQRPRADVFLPVTQEIFCKGVGNASGRPYLFEPDVNTIFNTVLPLYLLSVVQEVFGENRAAEQAARVMAMQSANDNAKKLLDQLQLEYNKLRQQGITNELLDIVGGQSRD